MNWPTPGTNRGRNAARNKFLGACSIHAHPDARVIVDTPGRPSFQATIVGWDDYTIVILGESGRPGLLWQQPGMRISPLHGEFPGGAK